MPAEFPFLPLPPAGDVFFRHRLAVVQLVHRHHVLVVPNNNRNTRRFIPARARDPVSAPLRLGENRLKVEERSPKSSRGDDQVNYAFLRPWAHAPILVRRHPLVEAPCGLDERMRISELGGKRDPVRSPILAALGTRCLPHRLARAARVMRTAIRGATKTLRIAGILHPGCTPRVRIAYRRPSSSMPLTGRRVVRLGCRALYCGRSLDETSETAIPPQNLGATLSSLARGSPVVWLSGLDKVKARTLRVPVSVWALPRARSQPGLSSLSRRSRASTDSRTTRQLTSASTQTRRRVPEGERSGPGTLGARVAATGSNAGGCQ